MASDNRNFIINIITRSNMRGLNQANKELSIAARRLESLKLFAQGVLLSKVGQGLSTAGRNILDFAKDSVDAAVEFDKGMHLVNTQAHLTAREFARLERSTLNVGARVTPSLQDLNDALYDIFSSVDLVGDRVKGATKILNLFAQAATAGQAPLRDVARGAIQMVNAFGQTPSIKNFTHVLDVQFRLVERGIGTVTEFVNAQKDIGPVAKLTGQRIDAVAASWAFLTKAGYSANLASTAIARGFQLLGRPETIKKMRQVFDIEMVDKATGKFRDFNSVLIELGKKLQGMPAPKKLAMLQEVFGKTRPVMTRFILAAINNFQQLGREVKLVGNNAGAMQRAFNEMRATPAVRLQIAMNKFRVAMVKLGAALIPMATKAIGFISKLADWFNKLSPGAQKFVAIATVLAGTFLVLSGSVLKVLGAMAMFQSMMALTGLTMAEVIVPMLAVIAVVVAVAVAAFLIIKYWKPIKRFFINLWHDIVEGVKKAVDFIMKYWQPVAAFFVKAWRAVAEAAKPVIRAFQRVWDALRSAAQATARFFVRVWQRAVAIFRPIIEPLVGIIQTLWKAWITIFKVYFRIMFTIFKVAWTLISAQVKAAWVGISTVIKAAWAVIVPIVKAGIAVITEMFKFFIKPVITALQIAWITISTTFKAGWAVLSVIFKAWWNVFSTLVYNAWVVLSDVLKLVFNIVKTAWNVLWGAVKAIWNTVGKPVVNFVKTAWQGFVLEVKAIWGGLKDAWDTVWRALKSIWNTVGKPFVDLIKTVWDGVKTVWDKAFGGLKRVFEGLAGFIGTIFNRIVGIIRIAVNAIATVINAVIDAYNVIPGHKNLKHVPYIGEPSPQAGAGAATGATGGAGSGVTYTAPPSSGQQAKNEQFQHGGVFRRRRGGYDINVAEGVAHEAVVPLNSAGAAFIARALARYTPLAATGTEGKSEFHAHITVKDDDLATALRELDWMMRHRGD